MKKNNLMPDFWKWFPIIIFGIIIIYNNHPIIHTIECLLLLIVVFVKEIAENTLKEKDKNNNNNY